MLSLKCEEHGVRLRVREGQVECPRAKGSRADDKVWDRLSLLSPGKLELPAGGAAGGLGSGQCWGQTCCADTLHGRDWRAEQAR